MYFAIVGLITIFIGMVYALDNDGIASINATMTIMTGMLLVVLGVISHRLHLIVRRFDADPDKSAASNVTPARIYCPECETANDHDAIMCVECKHILGRE